MFVPVFILQDENLTVTEKLVYAGVACYEVCYESNEMIAKKLNISESSVSKALSKLNERQFIFIEFVNGDSSKRHIYHIADKPSKTQYLIKKGLVNFASLTGVEGVVKSASGGSKICQHPSKICQPQTGVSLVKSASKYISNNIEEDSTSQAVKLPASAVLAPRPKRKDFATDEEFEKALYNFKA